MRKNVSNKGAKDGAENMSKTGVGNQFTLKTAEREN